MVRELVAVGEVKFEYLARAKEGEEGRGVTVREHSSEGVRKGNDGSRR